MESCQLHRASGAHDDNDEEMLVVWRPLALVVMIKIDDDEEEDSDGLSNVELF